MTTTIENAKTVFFKDKEHYLAFKAAWAKYTTHSASQHMLYNLLRGYPIHRGFTPISRLSKLNNGHRINGGLYEAHCHLKCVTGCAKRIVSGNPSRGFFHHKGEKISYDQNTINVALATWDGTVTVQMLAMLDDLMIPKIEPLFSDFGKGIQFYKSLVAIHLIQESKPLDPEFAKIVDDNFWDLLREPTSETIVKHPTLAAKLGPVDLDDEAKSLLYNNLWELYI